MVLTEREGHSLYCPFTLKDTYILYLSHVLALMACYLGSN